MLELSPKDLHKNTFLRFTGFSSILIVISLSLFLLLIYFLPTILLIISGNHKLLYPQTVISSNSPDNKYVLVVTNKVSFPVNEILDPSGTVKIIVKEKSTENIINSLEIEIYEYDDILDPLITWENNQVQVENIARYKDFSIKFNIPKPLLPY